MGNNDPGRRRRWYIRVHVVGSGGYGAPIRSRPRAGEPVLRRRDRTGPARRAGIGDRGGSRGDRAGRSTGRCRRAVPRGRTGARVGRGQPAAPRAASSTSAPGRPGRPHPPGGSPEKAAAPSTGRPTSSAPRAVCPPRSPFSGLSQEDMGIIGARRREVRRKPDERTGRRPTSDGAWRRHLRRRGPTGLTGPRSGAEVARRVVRSGPTAPDLPPRLVGRVSRWVLHLALLVVLLPIVGCGALGAPGAGASSSPGIIVVAEHESERPLTCEQAATALAVTPQARPAPDRTVPPPDAPPVVLPPAWPEVATVDVRTAWTTPSGGELLLSIGVARH